MFGLLICYVEDKSKSAFWSFLVFIHSCKKRYPFQCWKWKPYYWNYNFTGLGKKWQNFYLLLIYFFPNESFFTFNTVFYINNKVVILKQNKKTKYELIS